MLTDPTILVFYIESPEHTPLHTWGLAPDATTCVKLYKFDTDYGDTSGLGHPYLNSTVVSLYDSIGRRPREDFDRDNSGRWVMHFLYSPMYMNRRRTRRGGLFGWGKPKTPRKLSTRFMRTAQTILDATPYRATPRKHSTNPRPNFVSKRPNNYRPKLVTEAWVKTQLGPSVPIEDIKMITTDVNAIIKLNPSETQLHNAVELKKREGGHDWRLTILSLARSAMEKSIYNFA